MNRRVVVTGIGVISSIGIGKDVFWSSLIKGESGITKITSFDTSNYPTHYGGEVNNFNPGIFINKKKLSGLGRASCFAVSCARLGLEDSRLELRDLDKEKIGVILGTTMGESQVLEVINEAWVKKGGQAIDPALICMYPANVLSANVAIEFELKGYNYVIPAACAAGNYAIGYAYDLIKMGEMDIMFAGGVDAFSRIAFMGFNRLFAVAPERCQPFDKNRKGMLVGEGAGIIILEDLESALKREADIYAEVLGYGLSSDAYHMTAPEVNGIAKAIGKALQAAKLNIDDISYISAHGTGTVLNDKVECLAVKKVFGEYSRRIPMSSIKSMLGHTMGASSAIEAIACCLALKNDIIPPTINYETADTECDIDCVPNLSRKAKVNIALNNASAFGGNNASLVLKKFTFD